MAISKAKIFFGSFIVVTLIAACFAGYLWVALNWSYSKGERAGFVQKFSQKGWLIKTWEGELTLVAMPGTTPEKFFFTVKNDAIAAKINSSVGRRVALDYEQHKGLPYNWFGDTQFFVKDIKVLD